MSLARSLLALALLAAPRSAAGADEPGRSAPLAIRAVRPDKTDARVFERVTIEVDLEATYRNPFDSAQVRLDADVAAPSGKRWTVPGFLYQPFDRRLEDGTERLSASGLPRWQVRLALVEPGEHRVTFRAADSGGTVEGGTIRLTARRADAPGFVRRSKTDSRYFVTDRGETFFPIGANVCWGGPRGTFSYDAWLPKYAAEGCNYWRAWLSPDWTTFALNTRRSGYRRIDLASAWRLDHALNLSERLGMRALVCIDSFNILRSRTRQHGQWEDSPYAQANGGPCQRPRDYFTAEESQRAYRDRLRYLVARWGCSPAVMAWEFWNEVDIIDDYSSEVVAAWHRQMAQHLRSLDPWGHLITTSTARPAGDPALDCLPQLDFVQTHHYTSGDQVELFGRDRLDKQAARDRPHLHGEFGLGHSGEQTRRQDPRGIHLHNALYACVGQEHAGSPMTWWWDSYVDPQDLYPVFGSFARWVEGFDFVAEAARPVEAKVIYDDAAPASGPQGDPLRVLGLIGRTKGLVWIQNRHYRWDSAPDSPPPAARKSRLVLTVQAGQWTVEKWDTERGQAAGSEKRTVAADRRLEVDLPPIVWDAAFRLRRQ